MKILLLSVMIAGAVCLFLAWLSMAARTPDAGLVNGRLKTCPETPNCISSEQDTDNSHHVDPLVFTDSAEAAWQRLRAAIEAMGGKVSEENSGYLHAIFVSRIFRFVDDIEFRMQADQQRIQLRSASRSGYSDMGVNRKRVEQLRKRFNEGFQGRESIRRPWKRE